MKLDEIQEMLLPTFIAGPVPDDMICAAETAIGASFPPSYRQFLQAFGAGSVKEYEIFGLDSTRLPDAPPLWCDVVHVTLRARRNRAFAELINISSDGCAYHFYLDL